MSTADKLQQLRLERQKSDLSHKLQALQAQLERAESEKSSMAAESGNKIKQALSLLDTARKEIDKLKKEKEALTSEVTDLRRQNTQLRSSTAPSSAPSSAPPERNHVRHTSSSDDANLAENTRLLALQENTLNGTVNSTDDEVVVRRQKNDHDGSERPMSMAERMSMFESKPSGGRSFGNGPTTNGIGAKRGGWKNAQPQVKLAEEKPDDKAESSPVTRRSTRVSQHAKDNRHTMPPNMFSPKQISSERKEVPKPAESKPAAGSVQAASGRDKMRTALGGMMAAIETEKQHKGIDDPDFSSQPKPQSKFVGLVNDVAPKNPVKRAHSIAAPGSAGSKKAALLHWCQRMTEGKAHVDIRNFGRSWNDGMAFCALFHHFIPDQIPYDTLDPKNREFNFHLAFTEGEKAGVTALLDVEDMVEMLNPDWRSVMTYISLIYNHFNGIRVGGPRLPPMPGQE
ncbi:hypothetical protein ACHWQZ_G006544 [Mnemiopsis leidyi]